MRALHTRNRFSWVQRAISHQRCREDRIYLSHLTSFHLNRVRCEAPSLPRLRPIRTKYRLGRALFDRSQPRWTRSLHGAIDLDEIKVGRDGDKWYERHEIATKDHSSSSLTGGGAWWSCHKYACHRVILFSGRGFSPSPCWPWAEYAHVTTHEYSSTAHHPSASTFLCAWKYTTNIFKAQQSPAWARPATPI